MLFKNLVW